jgi:hypothetical protein
MTAKWSASRGEGHRRGICGQDLDRDLSRVNVLFFAKKPDLDEDKSIAAATRN